MGTLWHHFVASWITAKWKLYYSRLLWAGANILSPSKRVRTWAVIKEKIIRAEAIISKGATLKAQDPKGCFVVVLFFFSFGWATRYNDAVSVFLQHKLMRLIKCLIEHFKRLISNSIWVPSSNNKAKQKNPNKHTTKKKSDTTICQSLSALGTSFSWCLSSCFPQVGTLSSLINFGKTNSGADAPVCYFCSDTLKARAHR